VTVSTLERPLYSSTEAARLLGLTSQTLRRWLEGAMVRGVWYPPVIRFDPTGSDIVTWGEFVEAGLLGSYRAQKVPLQRMRPFIEDMRVEFGVPYPLAHFRPMIDNKRLVYRLQVKSGLPSELYLVRAEGGQMQFAPLMENFLKRVELTNGTVGRLRPLGPDSPVVIDPEVSFGIPQIRGVRTESIAESLRAGETAEEAATSWGVGRDDVDAAMVWENSLRKAA